MNSIQSNSEKYRLFESNAKVYSINTFNQVTPAEGEMSSTSVSGAYILVYSQKDIEYLGAVNDQLDFLEYSKKRSFEDEVYDGMEEYVFGINPVPFKTSLIIVEENEIVEEFELKNGMRTYAWFKTLDADCIGAKLDLTPFGKSDPVKQNNHEYQVKLVFLVPNDWDMNRKKV